MSKITFTDDGMEIDVSDLEENEDGSVELTEDWLEETLKELEDLLK